MSKLYESVRRIIFETDMNSAENLLYEKEAIGKYSTEYYETIISNFTRKKEMVIEKKETDTGIELVFDCNNINDAFNMLILYEYVKKNFIEPKIQTLQLSLNKLLEEERKIAAEHRAKGEVNHKEINRRRKNKKIEIDQLKKILEQLINLFSNKVNLLNVQNQDRINQELKELSKAISFVNRIRDIFEHNSDKIDYQQLEVELNDCKEKFTFSIPLEYFDGFVKDRIILREKDKIILSHVNKTIYPILEANNYDKKKLTSFFYNIAPNHLAFLLEKSNNDIEIFYRLPEWAFYEKNQRIIELICSNNFNEEYLNILNSITLDYRDTEGFLEIIEFLKGQKKELSIGDIEIIKRIKCYDLKSFISIYSKISNYDKNRNISSYIDILSCIKNKYSINLIFEYLDYLYENNQSFTNEDLEFVKVVGHQLNNYKLEDVLTQKSYMDRIEIWQKIRTTYESYINLSLKKELHLEEKIILLEYAILNHSKIKESFIGTRKFKKIEPEFKEIDNFYYFISFLKSKNATCPEFRLFDFERKESILKTPYFKNILLLFNKITHNQVFDYNTFIVYLSIMENADFKYVLKSIKEMNKLFKGRIKFTDLFINYGEELKNENFINILYKIKEEVSEEGYDLVKISNPNSIKLINLIKDRISPIAPNVLEIIKKCDDQAVIFISYLLKDKKKLFDHEISLIINLFNIEKRSQTNKKINEVELLENLQNKHLLKKEITDNESKIFFTIYTIINALSENNLQESIEIFLSLIRHIKGTKEEFSLEDVQEIKKLNYWDFKNVQKVKEFINTLDQTTKFSAAEFMIYIWNKRFWEICRNNNYDFEELNKGRITSYNPKQYKRINFFLEYFNGNERILKDLPPEFYYLGRLDNNTNNEQNIDNDSDELPLEEKEFLTTLLSTFNLNVLRSIFGIQNPKIISLLIYMNSVFRKYSSKIILEDFNFTQCILQIFETTYKYRENIEVIQMNKEKFFEQLVSNQQDLDTESIRNQIDEYDPTSKENDMKDLFFNKIRNAIAHFRFKLVRDASGKILEDKIYLYDQDNTGKNNFNIIIDIKDALYLTRSVELSMNNKSLNNTQLEQTGILKHGQ